MASLSVAPPPPATLVAGRPMPDFHHIGVEPISGACGAEISGVDLRQPLSPDV